MKLLDEYGPSRLGTEAGEGRSQSRPLNRQFKTLFSVSNNNQFDETELGCTEPDVSARTAADCAICLRVFTGWRLWRKLNLRRKFKTIRSMIAQSVGSFFSSLVKVCIRRANTNTRAYLHTHREIHLWEVRMSEVQEFIPTSTVWVLQEEEKGGKVFYSHSSSLLCCNKAGFSFGFWPSQPPTHHHPP